MITLSYSTINDLINCPHTWLNKQMGLKKQVNRYMIEGKEAHRVIQDHVSGKKLDKRLEDIDITFPIVEEVDFDERTHFTFEFNEEYSVHGYLDGIDPENNRFLEIKTSSTPWGMSKFYNLMQWRIYALSNPNYKSAWFITSTRDIKNVSVFTLPIEPKHREEATIWIQHGIDIIESGDFMPKPTDNNRFCGYIGCTFCK